MIQKWVSTYQCQECRKLVQVQYSCGHDRQSHKVKVLRSLEITEGNCRGCGEQLTENIIFYSGDKDFFSRLLGRIDMMESQIGKAEGLAAAVNMLREFLESTEQFKKYEKEKYAED